MSMSKNATDCSEMLYVNLTAGWKFYTNSMKSKSWLWLIDVAPMPSPIYLLCLGHWFAVVLEQFLFKVSHKETCVAGARFVPIATPLICETTSHLKENVFLFRTSSARRIRVSMGGYMVVRLFRKYCSPSECGIQVYKDVTSMVNKYFGVCVCVKSLSYMQY